MEKRLERVKDAAARFRTLSRGVDAARLELRREIVAAYQAGATVREIARAAGLSRSRVHQIVSESAQRKPDDGEQG